MPGVYIHIPFCLKKCKYCDFASYPEELEKRDSYTDALLREMKMYFKRTADTVYIGGGTPTCLECGTLERLLRGVRDNFNILPSAEFTIEANPKTVDREKARLLKRYGVNRISLGVQSFNDGELSSLGRIHTSGDAVRTFELLREEGFGNISLDLMYALPGQTSENLRKSVLSAVSLKPEHISCYGLKLEEGTELYKMKSRGELRETDDDTFADMYDMVRSLLEENGYMQYEISNFSRPEKESRHNLKYWRCEDYIGLGASAASLAGRRRFAHTRSIDEYIDSFALCEDYTMTDAEAMSEFVILGLRVIKDGVDKAEFYRRFGVSADDVFAVPIKRLEKFLSNDENSLKLRKDACLVSNSIMCEFMNLL